VVAQQSGGVTPRKIPPICSELTTFKAARPSVAFTPTTSS
jgi:hypothetical protein